MINEVVKGVDAEVEFKGFYGQYFYYLLAAVLGGMALTFFLYIIGFNSILVFVVMLIIVSIAVVYIKIMQEKYGRYGRIQAKHQGLKPRNIIFNKDFKELCS
jgi:CBS-domain-containing membrane protein